MDRSVKSRDTNNRPFVSMSQREAGVMVASGFAAWDGRKKRNIRFNFPRNAMLAFLGMMRHLVEVNPRAMDSKTHERLRPLGYQHVRQYAYSPQEKIQTV